MTSRPTFEDLTSKIPDWIFPGSLVLFDGFEHSGGDFIDAHTVGIVVNYWIIDLENIEEEDYNEMMKHGEWLLIDVFANEELHEHVYTYDLKQLDMENEKCRNTILESLAKK